MKKQTTTSNPAPQPNPKTSPFSYTQLAFLINYIIGHRVPDLSTDEVRTAAYDGRLLRLLATRYGNIADFYSLIWKPATLQELEAGLADAARLLAWSKRRAIGVSSSGLCLAMAIVLQAIQQQFHKSGPEQGRAEPVAPVPHRTGGQAAAFETPRGATGSPVPSTQSSYKQIPIRDSSQGRAGLSMADWLQLLLLVNSLADTSDGEELAFREVHLSIQGRYFPQLLRTHAQRCADFSFMEAPAGSFDEFNAALRRASAEMRGQEFLKGGISHNGFYFALALVLVAIRQQFGAIPKQAPNVLPFENN